MDRDIIMNVEAFVTRAKNKALRWLLPPPYSTQWGGYSYVGSATIERARPTPRLLSVASEAIRFATTASLADLADRLNPEAQVLAERWPGEHYRLLAAICATVRPKTVVEIGTASGLSALAILSKLPPESQLVSFDIYPWDYKGPAAWGGETLLREEDFRDGRLRHVVGDLSEAATFQAHRALMESADLFFIDGPKDGSFEREFLGRLATVQFRSPPVLVLDDIKLWNMLATWHEIQWPKLDLTSFGHWSGTGLVQGGEDR
jgi:predicted O-methyltransferase YrrM